MYPVFFPLDYESAAVSSLTDLATSMARFLRPPFPFVESVKSSVYSPGYIYTTYGHAWQYEVSIQLPSEGSLRSPINIIVIKNNVGV